MNYRDYVKITTQHPNRYSHSSEPGWRVVCCTCEVPWPCPPLLEAMVARGLR